ncbi:MAG: hypothetical protein LJE69_06600 [Thiohalocapsa sp.]|uniref:hypothetical protein n=1 Tax=Thiohalocapsa sp. TaxID=2497641 RepID=UPI0025DCC7EE|nr:hypothetical protein [Thiohalocapsa sp.]MCG6940902.1 hypothetical protein [Thiohalocapsa sp.]
MGHIRDSVAERGEVSVCTCIVIAAELPFGAAKKSSQRLTAQLETELAALDILPFDEPADRCDPEIRLSLDNKCHANESRGWHFDCFTKRP